MEKFKKGINNFELYLGAICSVAMIVIMFIQVIARYVFNNAFSWVEEVALVLFIFSIYFGAVAAILRNQHLRIELLLSKMTPKARKILEIISNVLFAIFCAVIMYGLSPIITRMFHQGTQFAVTGFPRWIVMAVLPVTFTLMIIRLVQNSMIKVKEIKELSSASEVFTDKEG